MRGARERGLDRAGVAVLPVERDVARRLVPDRRRAGRGRPLDVRERRQFVQVEDDRLRGVLRLRRRLRDDDRDRLADVADAFAASTGIAAPNIGLPPRPGEQDRRGDRADAVALELGPVKIATTPGSRSAAATSTARITPCPIGARTNAA